MSGRRAPGPPHGSDEPLLVFLHIQKTAGMTLRKVLLREYDGRSAVKLMPNHFAKESSFEAVRDLVAGRPPALRVVHGHILFWDDVPWPEDARFFSVLRDPVERVISHHYWLADRKIEAGGRLTYGLEEGVRTAMIRDNLQTRVLSGADPAGRMADREMLERAKANLDRCAVVGLVERFDATLLLLARAFGWSQPYYRRENVSSTRPRREEIDVAAIAAIEEHNALDRELYEYARTRFERDCAAQGPFFELEVDAFRRVNANGAAAPSAKADPERAPLEERFVEARVEALVADEQLATAAHERTLLRARATRLTQALERTNTKLEAKPQRSARVPADPVRRASTALSTSSRREEPDELLARNEADRVHATSRLVELTQRVVELEEELERNPDPAREEELLALAERAVSARARVERLEARRAELLDAGGA
jgi:hypothetical protein